MSMSGGMGVLSKLFSLKNGVNQGAVLSAIAYCVYVNRLFDQLRRNRAGCWVGDQYIGIVGYSDDNLLLAPSWSALQSMVTTCEEYAESHGLKFSTDKNPHKSKTKCLAFLKKKRELRPIKWCGNDLPWVSIIKHLGNTIENESLDHRGHDVKIKKAAYIARTNELLQEFHFASPKALYI